MHPPAHGVLLPLLVDDDRVVVQVAHLPRRERETAVAASGPGSTALASDLMSATPSSRTYTALDAPPRPRHRARPPAAQRRAVEAGVARRSDHEVGGRRSRISAAFAPARSAVAPSSEPASATVTSTGAATAAVAGPPRRRSPAPASVARQRAAASRRTGGPHQHRCQQRARGDQQHGPADVGLAVQQVARVRRQGQGQCHRGGDQQPARTGSGPASSPGCPPPPRAAPRRDRCDRPARTRPPRRTGPRTGPSEGEVEARRGRRW